MATRRIRNESFENMSKIVPEASNLEAHVEIDPITANACIEHDIAVEHIEEIKEELNERAEGLVPEIEEPKNPVENGYTAPLRLDESFNNFVLNEDYFDTDEYRVQRYQDDIAECIDFIRDKLEELENKFNEGKYTAKAYADKLAKIYDYLTQDMLHRHLIECDETVVECDKLSLDECDDVITEADGRSNRVDEEDDKDKHLDFDMADFLMCLVADADDMNPKIPEGIKFKKFTNTVDTENENISGRYNLMIDNEIVGKILVDLVKGVVIRLPFEDSSEVHYKIVSVDKDSIKLSGNAKLICDNVDSEAPAVQFIDKTAAYDIRKVSSLNRAAQTGCTDTEVTVYGDNI